MIIRIADPIEDALAIMDGARDFASRVDLLGFVSGGDDLTEAVGTVLSIPGVDVFVAEHEGEIVGGIGILTSPYIWNPQLMVAEELFWWTSEDAPNTAALRLIREVWKECGANGVKGRIFKSLANSPAGVDRVYQRLGLRPVETAYMGLA